VIRHEAHGVDRFARRSGGDDDVSTDEWRGAVLEQPADVREDRLRLGHASGAAPLARREHPLIGIEQTISELAQARGVRLGLCMRPHPVVHRGHEQHGRFRGEQRGREQIVRLPRCSAGHEVRRRRRDDHCVGLAREMDVVERAARVEQPRMHGASGERFEGDRADELGGGSRHHDVHLRPRLGQQTREPRGLVAGDAARHAEQHAPVGVWAKGGLAHERR